MLDAPRDESVTTFLPVRQEEPGLHPMVDVVDGRIHLVAGTNGFVECPPGPGPVKAGTPLPFYSWS